MDGRKLFLFIAIMLAIQCKQEREPVVSGSAIQRQVAGDFQPAAFTQTDRLQRVLDLTPRIDSLFEAYAEAQHLPSYVYGIVMDGSLIHQQGWGAPNLDETELMMVNQYMQMNHRTSMAAIDMIDGVQDFIWKRVDEYGNERY